MMLCLQKRVVLYLPTASCETNSCLINVFFSFSLLLLLFSSQQGAEAVVLFVKCSVNHTGKTVQGHSHTCIMFAWKFMLYMCEECRVAPFNTWQPQTSLHQKLEVKWFPPKSNELWANKYTVYWYCLMTSAYWWNKSTPLNNKVPEEGRRKQF